ncbi:MAG: rhodanese-like domain-containing protein, partial [Gimesia chilikensis]
MSNLTSAEIVENARAAIEHISVHEVSERLDDPGYVVVDVRDSAELASGVIPGSVHSHRGGLEFALDPTSPMCDERLTSGATLIMVCGSGGRAALATKLALDYGLPASCMEGG